MTEPTDTPEPVVEELTEAQRKNRADRFTWDSADIVWDPHPDDDPEAPLTPTAPPV